jgi:hypothetical protein
VLKVIHTGNALPISYPVDPTAEFEGGMIAQFKILGNDILAGISDGTAPIGIIDDSRTSAFTKAQTDEIVEIIVPAASIIVDGNGKRVNAVDVTGVIDNPHIIEDSFTSTVSIILNSVNGIVTVPAGTELNYDSDEDGLNDAFNIIINYNYKVTTKPGDDTTIGSGKITVHYQRGFYATDQFDTTQIYPLNATLYVGLGGKLTTKQPTNNHPGIAVVSGPPSASNGTLEFLWL